MPSYTVQSGSVTTTEETWSADVEFKDDGGSSVIETVTVHSRSHIDIDRILRSLARQFQFAGTIATTDIAPVIQEGSEVSF